MSDKTEHPWWFPQLADSEWIARIRKDYPEQTAGMSDDWVRDAYSDGWKYVDTWDHLGDARAGYEHLADAYLELLTTRDAEVARLREDAARLNSIESNMWFVEPDYGIGGWRVGKAGKDGRLTNYAKSLRAAIDAAMSGDGGGRDGQG